MTTVVVQQAEPAYEPATTIGFGNVLRSEWTKLRSVRSTYWTLLMAVLTTVALGAVICARWAYVARHDGPVGALNPVDQRSHGAGRPRPRRRYLRALGR